MLHVRIRSFLARHRALYWSGVAVAAAAVAATVQSHTTALERERRAWGDTRTAWVAGAALAPGDPISATQVELPIAAVSSAALADDPSGRVALQRVTAGEVLTAADVGDDVVDLLPGGWRGVALPVEVSTPAVHPGGTVDVVAAGVVLAERGRVVAVDEVSVTIAVPAAVAAAVADAALQRTAAIVLRESG